MFNFNRTKGFSLIEVIFAIGIITLLLVVALRPYSATRSRQNLSGVVDNAEMMLEEARSRTSNGLESAEYGVKFEEDKITLYKLPYEVTDPDNRIYTFGDKVAITSIDLANSERDVVFNRLSGDTDNPGIITFSTTFEPIRTKTITIYSSGGFLSN